MQDQIGSPSATSAAVEQRLTNVAFFRVTNSERAKLDALAAERQLTLSELLRPTVRTTLGI
jgi:hypothetical protein